MVTDDTIVKERPTTVKPIKLRKRWLNGKWDYGTDMPLELVGLVLEDEFKATLANINRLVRKGQSRKRSMAENIVFLVTAYLPLLCYNTYSTRRLNELSEYIASENARYYRRAGVKWVDPKASAYQFVLIAIL
jgi:hypothetical protein